jgi:hypothetical protein
MNKKRMFLMLEISCMKKIFSIKESGLKIKLLMKVAILKRAIKALIQ